MKHWTKFILASALLLWPVAALSQSTIVQLCVQQAGTTTCTPVRTATPLPVAATITPSGTQNVNLTQILGAAPSATNPIWVSPATASTPWIVTSNPSAASTVGTAPVSSAALVANQIVKASAGNLYGLQASADSTLSAAAWWLMVYNAVSAPTDGAVTPTKCYAVPSGTTQVSFAFPTPVFFSTGITIGVSTTGCFTKTASTHAFISGDAQ